MTWLGVYLVLWKWLYLTLCVRLFSELILGSFGDGQVNKSRHYALAILLVLLRDNYVTNKWIETNAMS